MGLAQTVRLARNTGGLGIRVERGAAALGIVATHNLFQISNGAVYITAFVGEIVTVLQIAATTIGINHNNGATTADTALDAATLNVSAEPAGTIWTLPDVVAQTIQNVNCTVPVANYAAGFLLGNTGIIAPAGNIQLIVAGANNTTGSVRWSLTYIPIAPDASVIAV